MMVKRRRRYRGSGDEENEENEEKLQGGVTHGGSVAVCGNREILLWEPR